MPKMIPNFVSVMVLTVFLVVGSEAEDLTVGAAGRATPADVRQRSLLPTLSAFDELMKAFKPLEMTTAGQAVAHGGETALTPTNVQPKFFQSLLGRQSDFIKALDPLGINNAATGVLQAREIVPTPNDVQPRAFLYTIKRLLNFITVFEPLVEFILNLFTQNTE